MQTLRFQLVAPVRWPILQLMVALFMLGLAGCVTEEQQPADETGGAAEADSTAVVATIDSLRGLTL